MSAATIALAKCYDAASPRWLRQTPRITNDVRTRLRHAYEDAAHNHDALPYDVQTALRGVRDVSSGVDPRGGKERDQMIAAMDNVGILLAQHVLGQRA